MEPTCERHGRLASPPCSDTVRADDASTKALYSSKTRKRNNTSPTSPRVSRAAAAVSSPAHRETFTLTPQTAAKSVRTNDAGSRATRGNVLRSGRALGGGGGSACARSRGVTVRSAREPPLVGTKLEFDKLPPIADPIGRRSWRAPSHRLLSRSPAAEARVTRAGKCALAPCLEACEEVTQAAAARETQSGRFSKKLLFDSSFRQKSSLTVTRSNVSQRLHLVAKFT